MKASAVPNPMRTSFWTESACPLRTLRLCAVTIIACIASAAAGADDDSAADENARTVLQMLIDQSLDEFKLQGGPRLDQPLTLEARSRWDNNARGSASGLTGIYTLDGRAAAVVCVYPWSGNLVHDFGSLSRGKLTAERDGASFWSPQEPGVSFQRVTSVTPPSESRSARLLQLKELAQRRFSAQLVGWEADDSDRQELRLLPRPLYRYEGTSGEAIDGAVFAYVMGVDPEVLLVIEALQQDGEPRWEYAFVRRSSGELRGRLDDSVVWRAERYPNNQDPSGTQRGISQPLPQQLIEQP